VAQPAATAPLVQERLVALQAARLRNNEMLVKGHQVLCQGLDLGLQQPANLCGTSLPRGLHKYLRRLPAQTMERLPLAKACLLIHLVQIVSPSVHRRLAQTMSDLTHRGRAVVTGPHVQSLMRRTSAT